MKMIFAERKTLNGYMYSTYDAAGQLVIQSHRKLLADTLDTISVAVMNSKKTEGEISDGITFTYKPSPLWGDIISND